jgi:Family of unknown function (DUF6496)
MVEARAENPATSPRTPKLQHGRSSATDGVSMASRYGKKAGRKVKRAMSERKSGTLRSGRSGKKVKSRKQAIAIGLSEARKEGAKVPRKRKKSKKK